MKRIILTVFVFNIVLSTSWSQEIGFPFGRVTFSDMEATAGSLDSLAVAVVIDEFAEAHIDTERDEHDLLFTHHYKLKILKEEGKEYGNLIIPLYKSKDKGQRMVSIKVSSFNIVNQRITETPASNKEMFLEKRDDDVDVYRVAIPNVKPGAVIDILYTISDPFYFRNFKTWEFQSELPKLRSEYWATIPANYNYNISLKGFLTLARNEQKLIRDGFNLGGGYKADCIRYQLGMDNIPPFREEEYMLAPSNFISSVNFELMEVKHFNGTVDKITNEWKDADQEMKKSPVFGLQLKKGKDIEQSLEPILAGVTDSLERAKKVYTFIQRWYTWNEYYGKYCDLGIKKAFDSRKGNVGDINLSLIAALDYAGFNVEPMVLATRGMGLPTELFPVLSDFNYVVAKLNLNKKVYLLDATDPLLPFGILPLHCLNGKGRVFGDKPSYWYTIVGEKKRTFTLMNMTLTTEGKITGTVDITYSGYKAYSQRKVILQQGEAAYRESLKKRWPSAHIQAHEISGLDDINSPIKEKITVEIEAFDGTQAEHLILNPFLTGKLDKNPFTSRERKFPVDYGNPEEITMVLTLTLPDNFQLDESPKPTTLQLPNNGGRFLFQLTQQGEKLTMNYSFQINKNVYSSAEYPYLRELYSTMLQIQNNDLVFKRKP
jgi:hypothetical protein